MWHLLSGGLGVDIQTDIETEATWHVRASLSSLGAITQMWQRPTVGFEVPTSRDTHSDTQLHTRPDEKHRPVAGENLKCAIPTRQLCELLNWAIPLDPCFAVHTENLSPVKHSSTHGYKIFFCMFLKHEQMGLSVVALSLFLAVKPRHVYVLHK